MKCSRNFFEIVLQANVSWTMRPQMEETRQQKLGDFLRAHNDTIVEKKKLNAQMKQSIQNQKDKQWVEKEIGEKLEEVLKDPQPLMDVAEKGTEYNIRYYQVAHFPWQVCARHVEPYVKQTAPLVKKKYNLSLYFVPSSWTTSFPDDSMDILRTVLLCWIGTKKSFYFLKFHLEPQFSNIDPNSTLTFKTLTLT